jgi:NADH:ubiquinone oxidoreductase subunit 6 (subunit J)
MNYLFTLFVVFLVLKLTHVIEWSWWWVCVTLWVPVALLVLYWILVAVLWLFESPAERDRRKLRQAVEDYSRALAKRTWK